VLFQASNYDEAIPHLKTAVDLSERTGAMHALFSSMGNLMSALLKEARYGEALSLILKMSAYQERMGSPHDISYNLLREGSIYLSVGMEEATRECFARGRALSVEIGDRSLASWFLLMEGYREKEYGSLEKAKEQFMLAEVEARDIHDKDLIAWANYSLADIAFDAGDHERCKSQLDLITECPQDDEFKLRLKLIRAKLKAVDYEGDVGELFAGMETECKRNKLQELLWEVYSTWAQAEIAREERTKAIQLLMKGIRVVETIASTLPEEYRDRYLRQRSRKKLFAIFKQLTGPAKAEGKPPEAKVHSAEPAEAREGTIAEGTMAEPTAKKDTKKKK
jgi:tetratricopeptide (TPR) repeat protein